MVSERRELKLEVVACFENVVEGVGIKDREPKVAVVELRDPGLIVSKPLAVESDIFLSSVVRFPKVEVRPKVAVAPKTGGAAVAGPNLNPFLVSVFDGNPIGFSSSSAISSHVVFFVLREKAPVVGFVVFVAVVDFGFDGEGVLASSIAVLGSGEESPRNEHDDESEV